MKRYKIINKKKLVCVILIDAIGFLFIRPFLFLRGKRRINKDRIKKILVVRLAYIGDVIMTLPVLRPIRDEFPRAKIYFLTGEKEAKIIEGNPYIDHIITYDAFWFYPAGIKETVRGYLNMVKRIKGEGFDMAIDFRGDIRNILFVLFASRAYYRISYGSGGGGYLLTYVIPFDKIKHKISYHLDILRSLDIKINEPMPEIHLSRAEEVFRNRIFGSNGIKDSDMVIGVHPGGRKLLKRWDPEGYINVLERLMKDFSAKIIITGSSEDEGVAGAILSRIDKNRAISLCGKTGLKELSSLIKGFRLFITGDSAPMHIASATGTPVVAIFGPSKSRETGPYGRFCRVVEKDFPCRFDCDEDVCKNRIHHGCMKAITPDDVYTAARELIEGSSN
ncbi:glycosyltransferase family 9 protein [bacterium]|nr:glycosyltransferase family 9 protein [bacterium]